MHVYFLSEIPCILTVNGLPVGSVDGHERSTELDPTDRIWCELKCPGYHAVCFTFDEAFLLSPPENIRLYFTRTGVAVYAHTFLKEDATLRPITQVRLEGTLLTLYVQGRMQLSLENETGFHIVNLGYEFENAKLSTAGKLFLAETPSAFCLIRRDGTLLVQSEGTMSERGVRVTAEVPFHDSLGHTALCTWEEGKLVECRIRTARQPQPATYALALFESVLIGAEVAPFLSDNLLEKADALKEFLGEFVSVVLTENPDEVGLAYLQRPRVFELRYFRMTLEADGRISNIKPLE